MPVDSSAAYIPLNGSSTSGCWGQRSTLERSFIFVIAFLAIIAITLSIALVYKKCDDSHKTTVAPNITTTHPTHSPNITTPHPNVTTVHPTHSPNVTTHHPNVTTILPTHSPNVTTVHPNVTTVHPNVTTVHPNVTTPKPNGTAPHPKAKPIQLTVVSTTLDFHPKANEDNLTTDAIIDEPKS